MSSTADFQKKLDRTLADITAAGTHPRLLLHSCCGPCSSYVLEYLASFFAVTIFYDNPNIYPPEEYRRRFAEQQRFLVQAGGTALIPYTPDIIELPYEPERYDHAVGDAAGTPECGERCHRCYELRLRDTAYYAAEHHFDFFTTTLSISPFKNAAWINEIGGTLEQELQMSGFPLRFLTADFKKRNGFARSLELSKEYGLYRQQYCGCRYSFHEAEKRHETPPQNLLQQSEKT